MTSFLPTISIMKINKTILKILSVILALLLWQVLAVVIQSPILIVGPLEVCARLTTLWKEPLFFSSIQFSFLHIASGFALGVLAGLLLGFIAGRFSFVETFLWPYMACMKSVPVASIVVICLILLSASNLSVFVSFLIVVPVMYHNTLTGFTSRDKSMQEMADCFRLPGRKRFCYVTIPSMKPYLLAGIRTSSGLAWKAGVAAEVIGTPKGSIGQQIFLSKVYIDTDDLLAWTFVLVVLSVLFEKLVVTLFKKILP